jgi:hypothetical protein
VYKILIAAENEREAKGLANEASHITSICKIRHANTSDC